MFHLPRAFSNYLVTQEWLAISPHGASLDVDDAQTQERIRSFVMKHPRCLMRQKPSRDTRIVLNAIKLLASSAQADNYINGWNILSLAYRHARHDTRKLIEDTYKELYNQGKPVAAFKENTALAKMWEKNFGYPISPKPPLQPTTPVFQEPKPSAENHLHLV